MPRPQGPMNAYRAAQGGSIILEYGRRHSTPHDPRDLTISLLTELRHYADAMGWRWPDLDGGAERLYHATKD